MLNDPLSKDFVISIPDEDPPIFRQLMTEWQNRRELVEPSQDKTAERVTVLAKMSRIIRRALGRMNTHNLLQNGWKAADVSS